MKLGEKIRVFRTLKGYSQEVMAESLKLSVAGYGKIERNETELTVNRLQQIAELLEVKLEDILQHDEKISFHNYAGSHAQNLIHLQHYNSPAEMVNLLKTLYESRIQHLEAEIINLKNKV